MSSVVSRVAAASSQIAKRHFASLLSLETDCWDTHFAISNNRQDFVLLDVRNALLFNQGHLPNAINLPHKNISVESLQNFPIDTLFVVYCAGPHCNGADKAALKLAELERPVKKMIGGITGWLDEGFELVAQET
ncbi:rhodanese-like domain-containing protein [Aliiglaciecola lipolytica]|uniref:Rhodanese-related sulfurtransferase n=1 Tax=Aliiglaciecola lipolytica E3 TaxID=1127673 RepID=K6YXF0_9ALTE|nr:rhodanese-like domain-containing protein [Aliiglaciecola lipolytica]GAC15910.1 rhodanese-related sulfurtransferase [Aliiglaciecola lipolytica E3]